MIAPWADLPARSFEFSPFVALDFIKIHLVQEAGSDSSEHDYALPLDKSKSVALPRDGVDCAFDGILFLPGNYLGHA